jgi:ABC-type transporter lipoprotein component MlaA/pimeloyl-ACP methyl ester carboxylesterase
MLRTVPIATSLFLLLASFCPADDSASQPASGGDDTIVIPQAINDPLEPINRGIWSFNTVVVNRLIHPVGKGYRYVVREPVREKINNFSRNITYPGRVLNHALQGRWSGARTETRRFVANTTIGIAGIFDPATSFGFEKSDADFGQTFGRWGIGPGIYVVIPILGPSSARDSIGLASDTAMHPLVWVPTPYNYGLYGLSFNVMVDKTGEFKRLSEAGSDSYDFARQASALVRDNDINKFQITELPAEPALSSLNAVFFTHRDPLFPERAKTGSARISTTGRSLKYSVWMQDEPAPMVYLLPGLGGHRVERPSLALAELIYSQGNSVVSVSSVYNSEFMEVASTVAVPGHAAYDNRDLHIALDAIDHDLTRKYADRIRSRALLGFSMGGFQALNLAAHHQHEIGTPGAELVNFDRYIAINPPVDLMYGLDQLDRFYQAALKWPADQRTARIDLAFRKVAHLVLLAQSKASGTADVPPPALPFDRTESGFLVGYAYRTILRDIIYSSQRRYNLGVLQEPVKKIRRAAVYAEIDDYSFADYLEHFVAHYYATGEAGTQANAAREIAYASNLKNSTSALRSVGSQIRIIFSSDDFLLRDDDTSWLRSLAPASNVTVFDAGGHMGHLANDAGKGAVRQSLGGL